MAAAKNIPSDLSTLCLILAIFVPIIPPILMQDKLNAIVAPTAAPAAYAAPAAPVAPAPAPAAPASVSEAADDLLKLKELLDGLGDAAPETGFDLYEIEGLENNVDALVDGDFLDSELKSIEETFNVSLKFSAEDRDVLKEYIKDNGKEDLVAVIVQKIRGEI